jgi:hypothetical protein
MTECDGRLRGAHDERPRSIESAPPLPAAPAVPAAPDLSNRLELLGTFVSGADRYAVIRDPVTNEQDLYKVGGNPLPNHTILEIEPREVWLSVNGRRASPLLMGILGGSFSCSEGSSSGDLSPASWRQPGMKASPDPGSATMGSPGGQATGRGRAGRLQDWQIPNPAGA